MFVECRHILPHADCPACSNRHGCANIARQNKKSWRHIADEASDPREHAEREPLALPAIGADSLLGSDEEGPQERVLIRIEQEQLFMRGVVAAPLPAPASAVVSSQLNPPTPTLADKEKDAALEKRIDKFRWHEPEPEISRDELDRMVLENSRECAIRYRQQQEQSLPE